MKPYSVAGGAAGGRIAYGLRQELLWPDTKKGPFLLTLDFRLDDQGLRCTGTALNPLNPTKPATVKMQTLRIPIGRLTAAYGRYLAQNPVRWYRRPEEVPPEPADLSDGARPPAPRSSGTTSFYQWVADTYRHGLDHGLPPTKYVAEQGKVGVGLAAMWVYRARQREFLGPAHGQGQKGERKEKSRRLP
jgi:hypothetical protein